MNVSRAVQVRLETLRQLLAAPLAEDHALVEDYPGVGKTALARALARSLAVSSRACSAPRICLRPTFSAPMSTASASRDSSSSRVAINVAVRSPSLPAVPEAPTACRGAHFTSVTISANAWTAVRHHPPATASAARYVLTERALDVAQFELTATQAPPTPTSASAPLLGCVGTFGSRMLREPRLQPWCYAMCAGR